MEEIEKYGADILRLWVGSVNYQEDMRCSDELIGRLQDAYRKIRNTLRYLLGNTDDFEMKDAVEYIDMLPIDSWAVGQYQKLVAKVNESYDSFALHRVFTLIYNFCTVQMSSIYMDVLKDRLYCDAAGSLSRRSSQTAMQMILDGLVRMLAPILAHTSEEAWAAMKHKSQNCESVHLALMPEVDSSIVDDGGEGKWDKIMELRDKVLRELEGLRQDGKIASNQEAAVVIRSDDDVLLSVINGLGADSFAALCIVSEVKIEKGDGALKIAVSKSENQKCQRCWNYWPSVGSDLQYSDLCSRCAEVVKGL
jgi:isoleucyl-tRNA synthetase